MKPPLRKWGYPEHQLSESQWSSLKKRISDQWKPGATALVSPAIPVSEINNKQKDIIRDIFANITTKRISFRNDKRYYYSTGINDTSWSHIDEEIKIADAVIMPVNSKEIQDILQQAQQHDISIQAFTRKNTFPRISFPKNKLYCIISLEQMQKIIRFTPEQYQITVQSGITIHLLQKYLSEHGWHLPYEYSGTEHLSIFELLQSETLILPHVVNARIHTPEGEINLSDNDSLKSLFLSIRQTLGIHSEVTFRICPLPKYFRQADAQIPDLRSAVQIIRQLKNSGIAFDQIRISDVQPDVLFSIAEKHSNSNESKDFLQSLLKKSEEILFKDETIRPVSLSLVFYENQYNRSSALIKAKEIIHQNNGKTVSEDIYSTLKEWTTNYPYFEDEAEENHLDAFHLSTRIPFEKMEEYDREIRKKLQKATYYTGNRMDYHIQFSKFDFPTIQIDFYFMASKKHRKQADSFLRLQQYFKEYLQPAYTNPSDHTFSEELSQLLQNRIDPKGVLSVRTDAISNKKI